MLRPLLIGYLVVAKALSVHSNRGSEICGDPTGYNCLFKSNEVEISNRQVYFDNALPSYLTGTLIRNGAALFERKHQSVSHVFDGLAKLSSWKFFSNGTAFFSTRFVRSDFYDKTIHQDVYPPFLLFAPPKPKFNAVDRLKCFKNGIDNLNVNVYDFPSTTQGKSFGVFGDYWATYQISLGDLSTVNYIKPKLKKGKLTYMDMLSSGHPLPEPGTQNRLTFLVREKKYKSRFMKNRLVLVRMSSISKRSVVAEWKERKPIPYMHSFSVTQTKAIMLAGPYQSNIKCLIKVAAPLPCMSWFGKSSSTLYIADLKTGKKMTIKMPSLFVLHHINAYDLNKEEIVIDVASYDDPDIVNKVLMLDVVRDSEKRNKLFRPPVNKRLTINLKTKQVEITNLSTDNKVTDGLDMPAINERYRSKPYCFVYGVTGFADGKSYTSSAIIKKDMCNGGTVVGKLLIPSHYPVEPAFVPNPQGTQEDDGVLLVPFLRGEDAVTYLSVVDAKTMSIISKADMPDYIPISFHGRFYSNIY